jgi:predicted nuclease of predicted toxin-antitoxin system
MRIKLDENIDARLITPFKDTGHDAVTVQEQGLKGITDKELYELCRAEGYTLVTLDLDFSNLLRFPPEGTPGLVVLRGQNQLFSTMQGLVETLIDALVKESPLNKLWTVEPGRLRIHEKTEEHNTQ